MAQATQLLKTGLYDFNRNQRELRVFDGKAFVESGREHRDVEGGREVTPASNDLSKARKFDKKSYEEGNLFRWSGLRSGYLAEANVDAAGTYAENGWGGPGWWGADWYWDPWFDAFTTTLPARCARRSCLHPLRNRRARRFIRSTAFGANYLIRSTTILRLGLRTIAKTDPIPTPTRRNVIAERTSYSLFISSPLI
jgi:hypothetical protein